MRRESDPELMLGLVLVWTALTLFAIGVGTLLAVLT